MADKVQPKNPAAAAQSAAPTNRPLAEASTHSVAGTPTPSSAPSLAPGSLLGPYRLQEKLGEGGMGAVYKAVHEHLDKVVAIKVLPAALTQQADAVARFRQEMKAVGKVEHPNIVRAMDAGEIGGIHYLAMEYVEGTDLTHYIKTKGPMSIPNACRVIRQAALGLAAAHAAGLVHRDIKPSNLLAAKTGQIKLLDLGLARLASDTVQQTHNLTAAGQTFGTPDYMAPEQWDDAHGVDGRTDLYALGCTLCFLLTGHAPFDADKSRSLIGKMQAHVSQSPPDLRTLVPGIPEELAVLFEKLLTKKREDRLPTATALAEALLPFTKATVEAPASSPAVPVPQTASSPSRARLDEQLPSLPSIPKRRTQPKSAPPRRPKWLVPAAGGAGALVLFGVIVIVITNKDGTKTEIKVPGDAKVEVSHRDDAPSVPQSSDLNPQPAEAPPAELEPADAPVSALAPPSATPPVETVAAPAVVSVPTVPATTVTPTPSAPPKPAAAPKTIRIGPDAGMVATLKQALADANGGDTIEIATDEPLLITEPLSWNKPGPLTIRAAEGKRPILVAAGDWTAPTLDFRAQTADLVTLRGLTILDSRPMGTVIATSQSLDMLDSICVLAHPLSVGLAAREGVKEVTIDRCYFWRSGSTTAFTSLTPSQINLRNCLFAGRALKLTGDQPQTVTAHQVSFLGGWHAWQFHGGGRKALRVERSLYRGLDMVFSFGPSANELPPAELTVARNQLAQYQGVQNGYYQCDRLAPNLSDKAANDLAAWQSFTNNGEKNPQFVDPQFVRPDVVELSKTKLLPPKAFALKSTSPIRRMNIGCDVTQLPDLPPRVYDLLPPEMRPDAKLLSDLAPPAEPTTAAATTPAKPAAPPTASPTKPAAEPKTIRVGPDAGMVATLKDALAQANGGDTIEIATDEPLLITEPLSWNKPGPLTIQAAEGKRPILITDQTGQPNVQVIKFESALSNETIPATVTLAGLTFLDRLGTTEVIISTNRPLTMSDVTCLAKRPTAALMSGYAAEIALERCHFWIQNASGAANGALRFRSNKVSIRHCLFAGYGPLLFYGTSHDVRCEQNTFLTYVAWIINREQLRMMLHMERNLCCDLKSVGAFPPVDTAVKAGNAAAYAVAVEQAKQQLTKYRGVNNCYFQCDRLIQNLTPNVADDLAAWQKFTGNGEVAPKFVDPQFVRPEPVKLTSDKLFPPKAFALKSTSPIRRMKIGCDVTQLPDLPPRLYELLPPEMRPDAKLLSDLAPPAEPNAPLATASTSLLRLRSDPGYVAFSRDGKALLAGTQGGEAGYMTFSGRQQPRSVQGLGGPLYWHPDSKRFVTGMSGHHPIQAYDTRRSQRLGSLLPHIISADAANPNWLCVGPDGHFRGSPGVEKDLYHIALHKDGSQTTHTPDDFAARFGWANDPDQAVLLGK